MWRYGGEGGGEEGVEVRRVWRYGGEEGVG